MILHTKDERFEVIEQAFSGDTDIIKFFDPNVPVSSLDDVVNSVSGKIEEYYGLVPVIFASTESGYVFYIDTPTKVLVSFACRKEFRDGRFWGEIVAQLGGDFVCPLWSKNTRAIEWLKKNGMKLFEELNNITVLCH